MSYYQTAEGPRDARVASLNIPQSLRMNLRRLAAIVATLIGSLTLTASAAVLPSLTNLVVPTIVSSKAEAPFTSLVYVGQTTAPEWVLFSGKFEVAAEVLVPRDGNCTSDEPCSLRGAAVVYATGITGVGVTSGLKYQMLGMQAARGPFVVPGTREVDAQLAVILPRSIRPVRTLVVKVPVTTFITFGVDGRIVEASAPPTGLMGWWQAEGNAADTLGLSPGLLSPSEPVDFVPGRVGQAFSFNNAGFMEAATPAEFETPTVTVAAWVRAAGSPGNFSYLLSKGANACEGASYALFTGANGGLQFYVSDGASFSFSPDAGAGLWDGNWHLVAGTFDGGAVRLYVDGAEVGAGTSSSLAINYDLPTSDNLYVGAYEGTCGLRFTGDVEDVQVFGRALTDIELQGLFNAQQ